MEEEFVFQTDVPKFDEKFGQKSKFWFFECNTRAEFYHKPESEYVIKNHSSPCGILRFELRHHKIKVNFIYWKKDDKEKVSGYVEFSKPVTENMIKNKHGDDFIGKITTKQKREKPDGYFCQERIISMKDFKEKQIRENPDNADHISKRLKLGLGSFEH